MITLIAQWCQSLVRMDQLALVMIAVIGFIGLSVGSFAYRYLSGDSQIGTFFRLFLCLLLSLLVMVCADHLLLFYVAWCVSNALLVRLMIYKPVWKAARASGGLAARNFLWGSAFIAVAFGLLYGETGETSIQALIRLSHLSSALILALIFLALGAMTQSAIWPFHRWLLSSLNSPTPVSALMHAGLINGGGFLLARFAPLYLQSTGLSNALFTVGLLTALLGTLWKLMQPDVKRMLACSTMGQMGFMFVQCGLGLYPAAVTHLVWHGMFKAYLFLSSGSAARETRFVQGYAPSIATFGAALVCGAVGSTAFAFSSGKSWLAGDTTLFLLVIAFVSASQLALPILQANPIKTLPLALLATTLAGLVYGGSVLLISTALAPMGFMQPQPLQGLHIVGLLAFSGAWLAMLGWRVWPRPTGIGTWLSQAYVWALNASQPHPDTVTTHRNHYRYQ